MAGTVVLSTLNDSSGVLATQNGMTGIPKAWAQFTGSSATINGNFNISSVTRNGTGDYTVNFTTAMSNANYAVNFSGSNASSGANFIMGTTLFVATSGATRQAPTTSAFRFITYNNNASLIDPEYVCISVFSS